MDFTIRVDIFRNFIGRCMASGLIKDLYLQGANNTLFGIFECNQNVYGEVYETRVKFATPGTIKIANLEQIMSVLSRVETDASEKVCTKMVRVKSAETVFVITDGTEVGKMNVQLAPASAVEALASYATVSAYKGSSQVFFDKNKLEYMDGNIKYTTGYEIPLTSLHVLLKDAKAFKMEIYKFKVNPKTGALQCLIEDQTIGNKFTRTLPVLSKIGDAPIPEVVVSSGFRQVVSALEKEGEVDKVTIYFHKDATLVTDGLSFFYNIHTING